MRKGNITSRSNPFSPQGDSLNSAGQGLSLGLGGMPPRSEFVLGRGPPPIVSGRERGSSVAGTETKNNNSDEKDEEEETKLPERQVSAGDSTNWETSDAEMEDCSTSASVNKETKQEDAATTDNDQESTTSSSRVVMPVPQSNNKPKPVAPQYPNQVNNKNNNQEQQQQQAQTKKQKPLSPPPLPTPVISRASSVSARPADEGKELSQPPPLNEAVPPVVVHHTHSFPRKPPPPPPPQRRVKTLFSQIGFGIDHDCGPGQDATKAAIRAVTDAMNRGAVMPIMPAGKREDVQIRVKLGVPPRNQKGTLSPMLHPMSVNLAAVAQNLPHGLIMPIQVVLGGLAMSEMTSMQETLRVGGGASNSMCCVVACISTGFCEPDTDYHHHHHMQNGVRKMGEINGIIHPDVDAAKNNNNNSELKLKIRALEGANETLFREKQEIENEKIVLYKQLTIQEDALKRIARSRGEEVRDLIRHRNLPLVETNNKPDPTAAAAVAAVANAGGGGAPINDHHLAAGALVGIAGGAMKKHKPNPVCHQGQATAIELLSNRLSLPNGSSEAQALFRSSTARMQHAAALGHLKGAAVSAATPDDRESKPQVPLEHPELFRDKPMRSQELSTRAAIADDEAAYQHNEPQQRRASAPSIASASFFASSSSGGSNKSRNNDKESSSSSSLFPQGNSYTGELINVINHERMTLRSSSTNDSVASSSSCEKKSAATSIRRSSPGLTAKNNKRQFVQHDYHDYMDEMPTPDEDERCRTKLAAGTSFNDYFPVKLHHALDEIIRDGHSDIVSWQPHGRCFLVHKVQDFKDKILSQYFVLTKYSSFLRQLNLYGFCRLSTGPDKGAYYHELFLRGMPFLAHRMVRTRVNGHGIRPADNPETEPDFYKLPSIPLNSPSEPMRLDSATYTDRSMELPTEAIESEPSSEKNRAGISFPQKLHSVLDMIEKDMRADIISWQPHGRSIMVHKPDLFVKIVMPTYFRQTKITSFQRQLNMYGFQRISTGLDKGAYYHEFFLRGLPHLCARMVRTRVNGKGVRKPSNPESEPNFYAMRPLQPSEDCTTVSSADNTSITNDDE